MKRESLFQLNLLDFNLKRGWTLYRLPARLLGLAILTLCLAVRFSPALAQSPDGGEVAEALATDSLFSSRSGDVVVFAGSGRFPDLLRESA